MERMTRTKPEANGNGKRLQAEAEFAKLIENACVRGFHGTASVTVHVQDGHVQYSRVVVDRRV